MFFATNDCTDNGKPVVKQGRKAVNLSGGTARMRLSGCRRRSEKAEKVQADTVRTDDLARKSRGELPKLVLEAETR
jgi:Cdc6-like AAA superfamily ATPase